MIMALPGTTPLHSNNLLYHDPLLPSAKDTTCLSLETSPSNTVDKGKSHCRIVQILRAAAKQANKPHNSALFWDVFNKSSLKPYLLHGNKNSDAQNFDYPNFQYSMGSLRQLDQTAFDM